MTSGSADKFTKADGTTGEEAENKEEQIKGGFVKFGWVKGVLVSKTELSGWKYPDCCPIMLSLQHWEGVPLHGSLLPVSSVTNGCPARKKYG